MDRTIGLLREKNHFLEQFMEVNEQELANFTGGDFKNVEWFYRTRDQILDVIRCLDDLLEEENRKSASASQTPQRTGPRTPPFISAEHKAELAQILAEKDRLVTQILAQDLEILSRIETEKSSIIRDLRTNTHAKKAVHAYRGRVQTPSLDEEF